MMLWEQAESVSGSSAETKEQEEGIREGGWRGAPVVHLKHHTLCLPARQGPDLGRCCGHWEGEGRALLSSWSESCISPGICYTVI